MVDCTCGHAHRDHAMTRSGAGMCRVPTCRCVQYEDFNAPSVPDDSDDTGFGFALPVDDTPPTVDDTPQQDTFGGGGGFDGAGASGDY